MGKINTDNYPNRPFASYQDDDMFVLQDNGGETYTTNVGDIKNLADSRIKLEGVQVNGSDLPISGKKVNVDISGKTDLSVIAYTFNSEMGYFKGAYVTYNGKLYEFIQEHTGAWNPSHVREIRASGQYVRTGNGGYNNGDRATCEGYMTKASGNYSHAEGRETQAVGDCTHAEGRETIANSIYQHVEGKYNVADNESKYIHIIGNGIDDNNRSNALTLDWDGNLEVSGEVEDGNGEKISDKADKVADATSGHLAGLDANGNLTDSGVSPTEDVTVEGNPVTFESPFEQDAKSVVVTVKPIQAGSGTPSPENIRPISGIDEVEIEVSGKNLLPLTLANLKTWNTEGTWVGSIYTAHGVSFTCYTSDDDAVVRIHVEGMSGSTSGWLSLFKNGTLDIGQAAILSGCPAGGSDGSYVLAGFLGNPYRWYIDYGNGVDIPQDIDFEQVYIEIKAGYAIPSGGIDFYPMIRLATETDPTFEPYNPNSHTTTIPLPSTLYDADVDVTEGSGENRYGYIASYNGETLPGAWISDRDAYVAGQTPTTGAEVVYELATPTTLSLTPTDVELLEGTNVVSTNGEKVAVTYGRSLWQDINELKTDTEGKLNKSDVADIEGDTASKAYSVNEFMLRSDGLYKVTQPIASGASITASNTTKTTIGAVLTALLNA